MKSKVYMYQSYSCGAASITTPLANENEGSDKALLLEEQRLSLAEIYIR